jgi:hypothetical protein
VSKAGLDLGAQAELLVCADLIKRGFRVYWIAAHHQAPDIVILDEDNRATTIEVRVEWDDRGRRRRNKKKTDRAAVYAWVSHGMEIEYEPALPATVSDRNQRKAG